jgi:ferredoxin
MAKVTLKIDPSTCTLAGDCVGTALKQFQIASESDVELIDGSGSVQGMQYTFEATDAELEKIEDAIGLARLGRSA